MRNQSNDDLEAKSRNPNGKAVSTSESNSRLANLGTKTENVRPNSSQNQLENRARRGQPDALNADLDFPDDEAQEDLMKSLYGLVKL